jgi:uncharacterized Tic20 family protein
MAERPGVMYSMDQNERTWGMLCHLSALIGWIVLPSLGNIIGPLIVWLVKKDEMPFVDSQGREALNFQISYSIFTLIMIVIGGVVSFLTCGLGALLFVPLLAIIYAVNVILTIIASVAANSGQEYMYPFSMRFF